MLRLIGCILIGTASVGLAVSFERELKEHLQLLYEIRQMLFDISQEAQYSLLPVERILRFRIHPQDERLTGICGRLSSLLAEKNKECGAMLWKQVFHAYEKELGLNQTEAEIIENAGKAFFGKSTEENNRNLALYLERLDYVIEHTRSEQKEKQRVLQTVSIMGGFMLIILLI
ncbi:MAG: stage III sporulation protein AB [Clostridiales bacterium]|nr:stage III sporulation protein AB [Clostridiales bacterium]